VAEEGFPGFDATTWYGLVGPKGMAPALVARMNEDINRALAMPDIVERLNAAGAEDSGGSPERFAEFMRAERDKYSRLVKDAGIKIDS
jgi:tripartite-type tricarboxylate transporter receptor subunit TctC